MTNFFFIVTKPADLFLTFVIFYSQTQLLLAEAITRQWVPRDASTVFSNGIRANMAEYGDNTATVKVDMDNYIAAHPLDLNNALEQINTQYWVSSFLDAPEGWSNFRRSGYLALTPNSSPGSELSGDFINRFVYPDSEYVVNKENLEAASSRQGSDTMDTRVWWDKK